MTFNKPEWKGNVRCISLRYWLPFFNCGLDSAVVSPTKRSKQFLKTRFSKASRTWRFCWISQDCRDNRPRPHPITVQVDSLNVPEGTEAPTLSSDIATVNIEILTPTTRTATFSVMYGGFWTSPDPAYAYGAGRPGSRLTTGNIQSISYGPVSGPANLPYTVNIVVTPALVTMAFIYNDRLVSLFGSRPASSSGYFQSQGEFTQWVRSKY
jgi:hypothetical protein